jgi:hypothetical protein
MKLGWGNAVRGLPSHGFVAACVCLAGDALDYSFMILQIYVTI